METLNELILKRDQLTGEILRRISDQRVQPEIKEVCEKLFTYFPSCNGLVLMAAYKGDNGERYIYNFDEIEESQDEGIWFSEISDELWSVNSWITDYRPAKWEPEIDEIFDKLASLYPYPLEEEFDWDSMGLGEKKEIIILKGGIYV